MMCFNRWRAILTLGLTCAALASAASAQAGLFDDDEARRAVLDVRSQLSVVQRALIDQSNRLEPLQQQVADLRGQSEQLTNQLTDMQRAVKNNYTDLDQRLKKFEPQQQTVDGMEGTVQPGESETFDAALQQFRNGDFNNAALSFKAFIRKYPHSPYQPTAQYWLGNSLYAQRDYKGASAILQNVVKNYPSHPRAPEALFSIAQNQFEQGQKSAALKTLQQIMSQYGDTQAAQNAQNMLKQLR